MRIVSATIHLLGSSILAYCIACRIRTFGLNSIADLKSLSWPRWCVLLILIISWLFVFGGENIWRGRVERANGLGVRSRYSRSRSGNVYLLHRVLRGYIPMHLVICGHQAAYLLFFDRESAQKITDDCFGLLN
jgi:hypothetical protein